MYRLFYAERDATIYERFTERNTGIDQILELIKLSSASADFNDTLNTRILLDFGSEIDTLRTEINNGKIPPLGNSANSSSVFLKMFAAESKDLLRSYSLEAYPVSESWTNGNGIFSDTPEVRNGVSWLYRSGTPNAVLWNTSVAHSSGDASATITNGGGTWITGSTYEASQSFQNEVPDIRMNVTDIVKHWVDQDITNNGFIVKRSETDELSGDILGSIQFYGRETHTVFVPRLEVAFDNTTFINTGSAEINSETYVPYIKNIRDEYRTNDIAKFRIGVRPEFPTKTYTTSSFFLTDNRLPTSSFYSILDSVTDDVIIPFDTTATRIDCDANGSFFKLRMDSFFPERFYKIKLKIERDGGDDVQTFDDFYFKVVK
jgi:hypothetical protein